MIDEYSRLQLAIRESMDHALLRWCSGSGTVIAYVKPGSSG